MAKPRPQVQGMMLLALLLLLASIQAGPVMALGDAPAFDLLSKLEGKVVEKMVDKVATVVDKRNKPGFGNGWKMGKTTGKQVRKAHDRMEQNPGGAIVTPYYVNTIDIAATGPFHWFNRKLVTADITVRAVATIGFCATAAAAAAGAQQQLIRLVATRPGSKAAVLGPLPGTLQYCPAAVGEPAGAVLGLGRGGELSSNLRIFSYRTSSEPTGNTAVIIWLPQPQVPLAVSVTAGASTTLLRSRYPNDSRYYVQMTGIQVAGVGQELVELTPAEELGPPPYLSTTQTYTYIQPSVYDRLRAAVIRQMQMNNPRAMRTSSPRIADQLCYAGAGMSLPLQLPRITILLASNNAAMGTTMELGGPVWDTTMPSMSCLGILPATTEGPVLGSMIQSGRTMTIDLTAAGGLGTITAF